MDDVEYILRIVLRARDEMAAVLRKARTQIKGFAEDTKKMNDSLNTVNAAMATFDKNLNGITEKLQAWRAVLKDAGKDADKIAKSVDSVTKSTERSAKANQAAMRTQEDYKKRARELRDEVRGVAKAQDDGVVSADHAVTRYKALAKELEKVSEKMTKASRLHTNAPTFAAEARELADAIKARVAAQKQLEADIVKTLEASAAKQKVIHENRLKDIEAFERRKATAQGRADKEEAARQAELERNAKSAAAESQKNLDKQVAQLREIQRVTSQRAALDKQVLGGGGGIDRGQAKRLAQDFDKLSKSFETGSEEAKHWAQQASNVRSNLDALDINTKRTGSSIDKLSHSSDRSSTSFSKLGTSVGAFDNQMRGLGILLAVVSIQQLISVVTALGGELVSLAGSAVMAGGALGGILAAGAAQALPVIGLLAGAFSRVKNVMDAFQQSQKLQQAQFTDAEKGSQKAIDKTNQLASAQDTQAQAQDRLAESRESLTKANADGARQLEDLIYQEKAAALAAKGASLNVKEAQEALAKAIATGSSQLEIDEKRQALAEARQSQGRAGTTARRATQDRQAAGGKIGNLDSVKSATKAVKDAETALGKANRGLDQAQDKTDRLAATTMTAAANLDFLLSQLSPAERKLYTAFNTFYANYKRLFSGTNKKDGIYGVIIDSFTRAVDEADRIIQMPKVIKSVQGLSDEIAHQINKIVNSFTTPKGLDQLIGILDAAQDNLGPVVDMAVDLGHAFLNIAETANPAFQDLLKYLGPVVDKFLGLTENSGKMEKFFKDGESNLESWLDLIQAVIGLFAELVGASADEGQKSIDDLTKKIKVWTDWLDDHHDEVVGFFQDARDAAYDIGGVLENLAVTLFKSFDKDRVSNFADILNNSVIPAFSQVIDVLGRITDAVTQITDTKLGAEFVKWGIALFLFSKVSGGVVGFFGKMSGFVTKIGAVGKAFGSLPGKIGDTSKKLTEFGGNLKTGSKMAEETAGKTTLLSKAYRAAGASATFMGEAMTFIFGPWGLLIIAVVAGVVLLLKHFGKLDDVWRGIKSAFKIFVDAITPALKSLSDALKDMGIKADSFKDVLGLLEQYGKALADVITIYIVAAFKALAHILAGVAILVIRSITGVIKIFYGLFEIVKGIWDIVAHGDFSTLLDGLEDMAGGVMQIFAGIVQGIIEIFKGLGEIFLAPFKAAWAVVQDFFGVHSPSTLAMELGKAIIDGLVAGAKAAWKAVKALPGWIWDKIEDGFRAMGRAIRRAAGWLWDRWIGAVKAEIRGYAKIAEWVWDKIVDGFHAYVNAIKKVAGWLWDKWVGFIKAEIRGFKSIGTWIFNAISDSIHAIGNKLEDVGKRIIDGLIRGIKKAPKAISDAIDWLLDKVPGGGAIKKGLSAIGTVERAAFAAGGPVPGSGSGDTVPAMLTPGEHVLTKGEVAAAGGHGVIFALRALLGGGRQGGPFGFAIGGAVDPRTGLMHGGATAATPGYDPLSSIDYAAASKRAADARKKEAEERKKDLQTQREDYKKSGDERAEATRTMWNDMLTTTRRGANDIEEQIRDMRVNSTKTFARLTRDITGAWSAMWFSMMKVTYDGLNYIGHETNRALTAMGEDHIDFKLTAPSAPHSGNEGGATTSTDHTAGGRFAGGGWVGRRGQRGRDRGGYALGDGEAVLGWMHQPYVESALNAQYGFGLGGLFDRVGGYHAGGPEQKGFAGGGFPSFGAHPSNVIPGIAKLIELLQKRFPLLQVTSTTDHSLMTTSGNVSDHTTGHAVDLAATIPYMAKVVSFINSSGLWKSLKQGIHNPGLAVNRGERVDGPGFFTAAWPQHIDHIHLALIGMLGKVAAGVGEVARRIVTPRGSAASKLVQSILDRARKSANTKIASSTNADAESYGTEPGEVGAGAGNIFRFFRSHGFTDEQAAAWVGNFQQESGLNPAIIQPGGEGHGLAQWGHGRFDALVSFAKSHKKPWTDMGTQLAFVMYELQGSESAAYRAIKAAKSIEAATNAIGSAYERYGIKGDRSGPARAAFKKFAGKFDAGGIIPGPDGAPTPILAHAGEWVLNKGQQLRAALLAGLTPESLRSVLGFHGGPGGAAGGTEVTRLTKRVARGVNPDDLLEGVDKSLADVRAVMTAVNKLGKKFANIGGIIDLATKDGGLLDNLRSSIERQFAQAALRLRRAQFSVTGPRGARVVARVQDDVQVAQGALGQRQAERSDLVDERDEIKSQFDATEARRKKTKKGSDRYKDLTAKMVKLQGDLDESQERVVQNTEDIFNAQEDLAKAQEEATQKRLDSFQAITDSIKDKFTKRTATNDLAKRVASALGSPDLMAKVNENAASIVGDNLNELIGQLHQARTMGYTEKAAGLEDDIAELYVQAQELAQQALRDQVDTISTAATRRGATLDLFGRMADAMGAVGQGVVAAIPGVPGAVGTGLGAMTRAQVAQGRIDSAEKERAGYVKVLGDAQAAGNVGLSQELIDKINDLTVQIVENTKAARDAAIAAHAEAFDYNSTINDLNRQLVEATDAATGQTSSAELLRLAQERQTLLQTRQDEIQKDLDKAIAANDQQATQDLTKELLQNKIAVQQNTTAINEMVGAASAPVSYSSTPWGWMRIPLLTGTGSVNPQYTPPGVPAMSGPNTGSGGMAHITGGSNSSNTYIDIEVNEAGQPIDTTKLASDIVYKQATAY